MPGPATKLGSMTGHGGSVIGPGCPTVLINSVPAIRVGTDMHLCPMVTPAVPPIPHVGMTNIGPGVPNVLIGGMPASTVGDMFLCVGPPAPVITGAFNVLIGTGGAGGGGGSSNAASSASPEAMQAQVQSISEAYADEQAQEEEDPLTISDIVEILEAVEREDGYEAASFFATHLDYGTITETTKKFIAGEDTNPDNDPNLMPTRFMLLYGADDKQLQQIDDHPDCADGEEHKINVANLRKSLKMMGYQVAETGPYDDEVHIAHVNYMAGLIELISTNSTEQLEENGEGILEAFFEDETGAKISQANVNQIIYLIIKTNKLVGKKIDVDLRDTRIDFEYNSIMLKDDKIIGLNITNDVMRIKLLTHKRRNK